MNPTTAFPSQASLDREVLARLRSLAQDTDPALFAEILGTYRDDLGKYLAAILQSLEAGDAAAVHRHAHAIKGASLNTGALALGGISARVETAAEAGDLGAVPPLLVDMEAEIRRVRADIALELQLAA